MNKKQLKIMVLQGLLFIEALFFGYNYLFGYQGLYQLKELKKEAQQLACEINTLKNEIASLEKQLNDWNQNQFYKERIAREKLQLAKEDEKIYFLS